MKNTVKFLQRGFIHITTGDCIAFLVVVGLIGYAILRSAELLWPLIKAVIHAATA